MHVQLDVVLETLKEEGHDLDTVRKMKENGWKLVKNDQTFQTHCILRNATIMATFVEAFRGLLYAFNRDWIEFVFIYVKIEVKSTKTGSVGNA